MPSTRSFATVDHNRPLNLTHIDPASFGAAGVPDAPEDLYSPRHIVILAEQLHLHFTDDLIAQFD